MVRNYNNEIDHGYSLVNDARNVKINNPHLQELAEGYDEIGYMSKEVGYELDSLYDDPEYIVGIHRTGFTRVDNQILTDMFNLGYIIMVI